MTTIVLIMSTLLALSSSSWVMIWIFIEVNTIAITIITEKNNNIAQNNEMVSLSYYLIQCLTSITILTMILIDIEDENINSIVCIILIIVNIGIWPFYLWYTKVIIILDISNNPFLLISTWQNILPLILISYLVSIQTNIVLIILTINIIVSIQIMENNSSINWVIVSSSVFNNSWIILSTTSVTTLFMFIGVYSTSMYMSLNTIENLNKNNFNSSNDLLSNSIILINISGMPPIIMFFGNIMLIKTILIINIVEITIIIVIINCVLIFNYFINIVNFTISSNSNSQIYINENTNTISLTLIIMSVIIINICTYLGLT